MNEKDSLHKEEVVRLLRELEAKQKIKLTYRECAVAFACFHAGRASYSEEILEIKEKMDCARVAKEIRKMKLR